MLLPTKKFLLTLGLIFILTTVLAACGDEAPETQTPPAPNVSVIVVTPERVATLMILSGRSSAYLTSEVRPQVGGIIKKRLFVEGAQVREGDIMYLIDPAPFQANYDQAKANLMRSEATLSSSKLTAERYAEAVKFKGVSKQQVEDVKAAYDQAKAETAAAKAALDSARINLDYTKVKAPVSGNAGISSVTEGALVTPDQLNPLTTVQQTDPMYIDVTQSSSDYLRLLHRVKSGELVRDPKSGLLAKIYLEDGSLYPQTAELLLRDITINEGTGSYTIRAKVNNPEGTLLPNMYIKAEMEEGINDKGVIIPQQALQRNQRGEPMVYLLTKEGTVEARQIKTNRVQHGEWIIDAGLNAGDQVIVEGFQKVHPGGTAKGHPYAKPANNGKPDQIKQLGPAAPAENPETSADKQPASAGSKTGNANK